jgi:hypothetical protein
MAAPRKASVAGAPAGQRRKSVFERITGALGIGSTEEEEPEFTVSEPFNFKQLTHVKADPRSSTGFSVRSPFFLNFGTRSHTVNSFPFLPNIF